jgi:hypothetical protein
MEKRQAGREEQMSMTNLPILNVNGTIMTRRTLIDSRNDTIDLELTLHLNRPDVLAICVSADGEKRDSMWLPKSQIAYDENASEGDVITVSLPVWLATEKGLV